MARKKNNTWLMRSKHGRNKIFENPEMLLVAVTEYFEWADKTPWHKNEAIKYGDNAGTVIKVPIQRPYTIKALVHFLDIDFTTWKLYKSRPEFQDTVSSIEDFIYNQKLEGAICSIFNSSIIARHLGLVERQDQTTNGESITGSEKFLQMLMETSCSEDDKQ
jgi:hypothetical protein